MKILGIIVLLVVLYPITLGLIGVVAFNLLVSPFSMLTNTIISALALYSEFFGRLCDLIGLAVDASILTAIACVVGRNYGAVLSFIAIFTIGFFNLFVFDVFTIMPSIGTFGFSGIKEVLIETGWLHDVNEMVNTTTDTQNLVNDAIIGERPFPIVYCIFSCIVSLLSWRLISKFIVN